MKLVNEMKLAGYTLLIMLFFSSCMKEASDELQYDFSNPFSDTAWSQFPSSNAFINTLPTVFSQTPLSANFNLATGDTLKLSSTLTLIIPPNVVAGSSTSGPAKVEVLQLKTKGDYVRSAKPTTNFNRLLETAGGINIKIIKDGQELQIASNKQILIEVIDPTPATNKVVLYGQQNLQPPLPIATNAAFTWSFANDSSRVSLFQRLDTMGFVRGYLVNATKLNWISWQSLVDTLQTTRTRMDVILPFNFTNNNTSVYAVFKNEKTVVQLFGDLSSKTFFSINLPVNKNIQLVSISKSGNDLYLGSKDLTITNNSIQQLRPEKRAKDQIIQFLEQL